MYTFCEECVGKKCNIGTTIDLEVVDFSDVDNKNVAIYNERHDLLHDTSDEGSMENDNKTPGILHTSSDETHDNW